MMQRYCHRDKHDEALVDVFDGVNLDDIVMVLECHGSLDDDVNYVFLI